MDSLASENKNILNQKLTIFYLDWYYLNMEKQLTHNYSVRKLRHCKIITFS